MKEPTKEQVLDALQTHKTVQKAAKALGLSYPKMQHWLKKYGIVCNHNIKKGPLVLPRNCRRSLIADWFATQALRYGWPWNTTKGGNQ